MGEGLGEGTSAEAAAMSLLLRAALTFSAGLLPIFFFFILEEKLALDMASMGTVPPSWMMFCRAV